MFREAIKNSIDTIKRYQSWVWLLILLNISFLAIATTMVRAGIPWVIESRDIYLKEIPKLPYLKPLTGGLSPYLSLKIIYTFLFNLVFGAFLSTTLTGIIFFLPILINIYRAWFVGIVFYGFITSPIAAMVFLLTLLLEFGGYILSSVAGIVIGLAILFPDRYGTKGRLSALRKAIEEAGLIYIMVIILLFIGAVWEMSIIHILMGGFASPPKPLG